MRTFARSCDIPDAFLVVFAGTDNLSIVIHSNDIVNACVSFSVPYSSIMEESEGLLAPMVVAGVIALGAAVSAIIVTADDRLESSLSLLAPLYSLADIFGVFSPETVFSVERQTHSVSSVVVKLDSCVNSCVRGAMPFPVKVMIGSVAPMILHADVASATGSWSGSSCVLRNCSSAVGFIP
jgi:hypothetical protein